MDNVSDYIKDNIKFLQEEEKKECQWQWQLPTIHSDMNGGTGNTEKQTPPAA